MGRHNGRMYGGGFLWMTALPVQACFLAEPIRAAEAAALPREGATPLRPVTAPSVVHSRPASRRPLSSGRGSAPLRGCSPR